MPRASVVDRCYESSRSVGLTTVFGNPGSTEGPCLKDFPPDFRYVLGLHEAGVAGMAAGSALAGDRGAPVNLHTAAGMGNAIGEIIYEKNRLLAMPGRNEVPLGMQSFTDNPALIEVIGLAGFDLVMIDTKHSGNDPRAMEPLIRAAGWAGLFPFVRVGGARNEVEIRRALGAGARGLFLPEVDGPEDVQIAADAAFFPTKGHRGICPAVRAARDNFETFQDDSAWDNAEISLVPMIENPRGVENGDAILALEDVNMVVFGAGDLGLSVAEGTSMLKGQVVQEDYRKVLEAAKRHDVAVIGGPVLDATPESCREAIEGGVRIFSLGLDAMGKGAAGTGFRRPPMRDNGFDPRPVAGQRPEAAP